VTHGVRMQCCTPLADDLTGWRLGTPAVSIYTRQQLWWLVCRHSFGHQLAAGCAGDAVWDVVAGVLLPHNCQGKEKGWAAAVLYHSRHMACT
jgi:hypothetical protein